MFILKRRVYISLVIIGISVAVLASIYWNEARKEVVFLCGNFGKGVSQSSVLRQLNTGSFLRYQVEKGSKGTRINVDSILTFGFYQCIIDFDLEDNVIQAEIR